ncbi:MAG: DNA primase [Betaproteobacteria bacterium]
MALFPQSFIDDLRLQANIVQVVQEYVPLKRAGRTYKGLCPFHAEKTPSFHVDPDKGFFHCFGCGVGGDVFKFLELHEKVGFQDALRMLAQKFGVSPPEMTADAGDDARRDAAVRESLLKMHEIAAAYFREQLAGKAGARARQQLADRNLTPQTVEQLGLGYAPAVRDGLKDRLTKQGFAPNLLVQGGLVVQRDNGELIDRFRHRLMVPICRDTGSVIAFGGRQMDADQGGPKYLNSPETPIYSKSRTLYGLNLTKGAIRKVGFAVLVEGYFDFAQVFQSQAAPAVASCGTALTAQQAQLLRRFTSKVVLSYDPDAAGEGAAARSCELLVTEGFDVNVVVLDRGEDPDTFIRHQGPERYRDRLRASRPYLEYLLDHASAGVDFAHDESRRRFLTQMLAVAARIPDPAARDQFGDRLAHKARITEDVVRAEIRKAAVSRRTTLPTTELPGFGTVKPAERGLIWGLFHRTAEALALVDLLEQEDLETLAAREVFEVARGLQAEPLDLLPSELLRRLSTMQAQLVTGIAGEPTPPATALGDCVRMLKRLRCERERAAVQREIDRLQGLGPAGHGEEIDVLLNQKRTLAQRIEELT